MNKLEQLTKAIQLANPDIMKLEMGCWFIYDDIKFLYGENKNIIEELKEVESGEIKILGRDITLEDCLTIIEKDKKFQDGDEQKIKLFIKILMSWQLGKPLHQQEQETIDFLWDLICNK